MKKGILFAGNHLDILDYQHVTPWFQLGKLDNIRVVSPDRKRPTLSIAGFSGMETFRNLGFPRFNQKETTWKLQVSKWKQTENHKETQVS